MAQGDGAGNLARAAANSAAVDASLGPGAPMRNGILTGVSCGMQISLQTRKLAIAFMVTTSPDFAVAGAVTLVRMTALPS